MGMASVIKQVQGSPLQPRCALDSLHVICFQTVYRMNTIACGSKGGIRQHIDNEIQEHNLSNRNVIYIYIIYMYMYMYMYMYIMQSMEPAWNKIQRGQCALLEILGTFPFLKSMPLKSCTQSPFALSCKAQFSSFPRDLKLNPRQTLL